MFSTGITAMFGPLSLLNQKITLDPHNLPGYLLRTGVRFIVAMFVSIIFAILYAAVAAKNLRMRKFMIPLLDIFQSIPVLGYLSFTVTAFVSLTPHNIFGVELAVIFAICTAQVWNMIFSLYQSFITVPKELYEVAQLYKLNQWKVFWIIELPFAVPGLIWNIILSMAASWFYIVAQEVIAVGTQNYTVPGMGAYITLALQNMDIRAVIYATFSIISLIFIFNELFFKPLVSWSYKFRYEFNIGANTKNQSWLLSYFQQASIVSCIVLPIRRIGHFIINIKIPRCLSVRSTLIGIILEILCWISVIYLLFISYQKLYGLCHNNLNLADIKEVLIDGIYTSTRIIILLLIASLIWVPIGIYIGLRPKLASFVQNITQFLTAFPANLYYPIFVLLIIHYKLNPEILLSVMIVMGSQWYILYNVIGGAQAIPTELLEAAKVFRMSFTHKLLKITLPAILPFYMTGIITAAGASWNASIIAEIMTWGTTTLTIPGIGAYVTTNTNSGNFAHITLGLVTMSTFVIVVNHLLLQPLYSFVSTRYRLE